MKPRKQRNRQSSRPDVKRRPDINRIQKNQQQQKPKKPSTSNQKKNQNQQQQRRNTLPFEPTDRILLVGEGDFSFSHSLVTNNLIYSSNKLVTTCYESEEILYEKYPQSRDTVSSLKDDGHVVLFNVDITAAKKLPKAIRKAEEKFDVVVFNFPHTGGLTTDVSRQIRANQELLLGAFKTVKPLLSRPEREEVFRAPMALKPPTVTTYASGDEEQGEGDEGEEKKPKPKTKGKNKYGSIVVTLFDGKPYEDWNVKELAKSCGLKSRMTFKFDAGLYIGYKHALTIGHRERGTNGAGNSSSRKDESKPARTYVFEAEDAKPPPAANEKKNKKRKRGGGNDDSSDSD